MGLGIFMVFSSHHAAFSKACERDNEELVQTSIWQRLVEFPEVPGTSSLSRAWVASDASKRLSTPSPWLPPGLLERQTQARAPVGQKPQQAVLANLGVQGEPQLEHRQSHCSQCT